MLGPVEHVIQNKVAVKKWPCMFDNASTPAKSQLHHAGPVLVTVPICRNLFRRNILFV